MRIKSVEEICGGEILAEELMNDLRNVVIPAGTVLKIEYAQLLKSLGITTFMVEDPYEKDEKPNLILPVDKTKEYVRRVQKVMESHIYGSGSSLKEIDVIANEITKDIDVIDITLIFDFVPRVANLYEHTVMVTLMSLMLAKKLKVPKESFHQFAVGALLHDIGLRFITLNYENCDPLIGEPAKVSEYKKHSILGYTALENETWVLDSAKKLVLSHHETCDGTGFPMHQKINNIECNILQLCDAFDCRISGIETTRMSFENTLAYIHEEEGKKFSKEVCDAFFEVVAKYPVGTILLDENKRQNVVVEQTDDLEHPKCMPISPV